jgi:hypothetical protein
MTCNSFSFFMRKYNIYNSFMVKKNASLMLSKRNYRSRTSERMSGYYTCKRSMVSLIDARFMRCLIHPKDFYNKSICADARSTIASDISGGYSIGALAGGGERGLRRGTAAQRIQLHVLKNISNIQSSAMSTAAACCKGQPCRGDALHRAWGFRHNRSIES